MLHALEMLTRSLSASAWIWGRNSAATDHHVQLGATAASFTSPVPQCNHHQALLPAAMRHSYRPSWRR